MSQLADEPPRGFAVGLASDADAPAWDAFVRNADGATFFHLWGWKKIIEKVFNYECPFLIARSESGCLGVLPLVRFRNPLAGHALISSPFLVHGGIVARSPQIRAELARAAESMATRLGVEYIELRCSEELDERWVVKSRYVNFSKAVEPDHDANLKAIPRKQRAVVRKGEKAGLTSDENIDLNSFYGVMAESYRNLGTPIFSKRLFAEILQTFTDDVRITNVRLRSQLLSSVLSFRFRDCILPYYGGGTGEARAHYANDYMYWCVLKSAVEEGCTHFDFGRSRRETGSYRFKKHWGFEPADLDYRYLLLKLDQLPDLSPSNSSYELAIRTWQKLPVSLTRLIGPPIARCLG